MKVFSRMIAVLLVLAMAATLMACHQKDETVMTVGDVKISSGLYLALQLDAFSEFVSGVNSNLTAESAVSQPANYAEYFNYEYENKSADAYIRDAAKEAAIAYAVVEQQFTELGLELSKNDQDYLDSYAQYYWENNLKDRYEANGVSFATYKTVVTYQFKRSMLFNYYYDKPNKDTGKGGVEQVPDADLKKQLGSTTILADTMTVALTDLSTDQNDTSTANAKSDEEIKSIKKKLDELAVKINSGKLTYAGAFQEYMGNMPQDVVTEETEEKTIYPKTATSYNKDSGTLFTLLKNQKSAKGFSYGTAYVLGGKDDGNYYLTIIYDITKDPYYLAQNRSALLFDLKNDEFTKKLSEAGKKLKVEVNEHLADYYEPANIDFDLSSAE